MLLSNFINEDAYNVALDGLDNFVDSLPLVSVFGLSIDHLKTFKNVDDVVDSSSLHSQLLRALVQVE